MVTRRVPAAARMPVIPGERLAPPEDLDDFERAEWEAITSGLPPGWILQEHAPLLRQMVRHIKVAHRFAAVLAELIELSDKWDADDERWGQVRAMSKAHATETDHIISCAKSLRLTKLPTRPERGGNKLKRDAPALKPWLDWGHDKPVPKPNN